MPSDVLQRINSPEELKQLNIWQMEKLAQEIREFLIQKVSVTGGHLASNLGVVELTLALHKVFDTPRDKIVWDVGHQSYVHKILTGRKNEFDTLRQLNGISGFPKVDESQHDCFNTGHSSTSISAALGLAKARDIKKENYHVAAVIGDGALTGGMAFEALNDAGRSPNNFIVILNDNEMSISKNVGGLSSYLSKITTEPVYFKVKEDIDILLKKIPAIGRSAAKVLDRAKGTVKYLITPGIIFEELGFKYLGPIDGHNVSEMINVFDRAKQVKGPVFIHICTQKGKGYSHAEHSPHEFHGIAPFDIESGKVRETSVKTFSHVFGEEMVKLADRDRTVAAITAAMPHGTGLDAFSRKFPERFFDVGIAEQHAVTFAAGLARGGIKPVVAVYSTFLQRAYDQIFHDVALQGLHVIFAVDRAGIVGEDGETHQGLYDLSYLSHIPGMTIACPCDYSELRAMLEYAVMNHCGPMAIRYPRGSGKESLFEMKPVEVGKGVLVRSGKDVTIVAVGNMVETVMQVSERLDVAGISADVINARFVNPLDEELILESARKTGILTTIEDNTVKGGFGSSVLQLLAHSGLNHVRIELFGFPDKPVAHGSRSQLYEKYGLDTRAVSKRIIGIVGTI